MTDVVDDSVAIRSVLVGVLRQHGFLVYESDSGVGALTEWQNHKTEIGLVLADVVMPEMDGLTLAQHLRKQSSNLPIILLSGHINEDTQWVTEEANFSFLPKPFQSTQLLEAVRSILGIVSTSSSSRWGTRRGCRRGSTPRRASRPA